MQLCRCARSGEGGSVLIATLPIIVGWLVPLGSAMWPLWSLLLGLLSSAVVWSDGSKNLSV